jgi:hypothetical protein
MDKNAALNRFFLTTICERKPEKFAQQSEAEGKK